MNQVFWNKGKIYFLKKGKLFFEHQIIQQQDKMNFNFIFLVLSLLFLLSSSSLYLSSSSSSSPSALFSSPSSSLIIGVSAAWNINFGTNNILQATADAGGIAGTVCDDNFDIYSARGLCKAMGVNANPGTVWYFTRDGTSTAGTNPSQTTGIPIWLDNLNCSAATSSSASLASQCTFNTSYPQSWSSCAHSEDLGLFCFPWSVELNPATKVLQVRPGMNSDPLLTQVGTVCASSRPPDQATAFALCKLVGFATTATLEYSKAYYATAGSTSPGTPVYLRNINSCPSDTPLAGYTQISLEQCSMEYLPALTGSNTGCVGHTTDVALTCAQQATYRNPANPNWEIDIDSSQTSGNPVKIRPNSTAVWGTICSDRMTKDTATAICRMYNQGAYGNNGLDMGSVYASWTSAAVSRHNTGAGVIYVDELSCAASSTSINSCNYVFSDIGSRRDDCDHTEDTVVFCDQWVFAEEPWTRRLLVKPSPTSSTSGTVCGDGFGLNEARAVCRFLGYTSGIDKVTFSLYGSGTAESGGANPNGRPIYMSSFKCSTDASSIQSCTFQRNADPTALGATQGLANGCAHSFDIKIDCNGTSGTAAPEKASFFTSEIIIAILAPLIIILLCAVFLVVRYFTKEKEENEDNRHVQRSPGSQALSGMSSAFTGRGGAGGRGGIGNNRFNDDDDHDRHHRGGSGARPGNSFAPETIRGGNNNSYVDHDATFRLDRGPPPASPKFETVEMSPRNNHSSSNVRRGGVERPLPPQVGSAAVANPFARTAPPRRQDSPNHTNNNNNSSSSASFGRAYGPQFEDL